MSGNARLAYARKLTVEHTFEVGPIGNYLDPDYSVDHDELHWTDLETPLADADHIGHLCKAISDLLDHHPEYDPDDWPTEETFDGGKFIIRPGISVWHAPPDLPFGPEKHAVKNTLHEYDGIAMDATARFHRNAHPNADEL